MEPNYESQVVIQQLNAQISNNRELADLLTKSLIAANNAAESGPNKLNSSLYQAINNLYFSYGWPTTTDGYLKYLMAFAEVVPSENTDPSITAWNNNDQQNGYSQEIYDRLCHFYWLINQPVEYKGNTIVMQNYKTMDFSFAKWLVDYANAWGSFLNTPQSLTQETLDSFKKDLMYNLQDSSDYIDGWNCFNDFFYRKLNPFQSDRSPMRPIANPQMNKVVSSPADCTFKAIYKIDNSGNVIDNDDNHCPITLKNTHTLGTVKELLNRSELAGQFNGGTFVHYFLSPFDYHRFHVPVNGKVLSSEAVQGNVFLNVELSGGQFDAPDGAGDGYEFTQARGVIIIDTKESDAGDIGKVAIIPIGMAQVSSVHMELEAGQNVKKGDEFGYFAFGGSDIIMLFEAPSKALTFVTEMAGEQGAVKPFHFKYGEVSVIVDENQ